MFIQINLGGEKQKSGIEPNDLETFYTSCLSLKLDIVGTMCIPPDEQDPKKFFKELIDLKIKYEDGYFRFFKCSRVFWITS